MTTPLSDVVLSVVVPMFNEEAGLDAFFARIEPVLAGVTPDYEIVCVDDGSSDRTLERLAARRAADPRVKVLSLSRNFGKDTALSAGLDHAIGQAVVPIDADLQDPPEVIPQLFAKWREGYEVVYAHRVSRMSDDFSKRVTAGLFYRFHNLIADVRIPHDTGDFRLLDRRVVEALKALPERTRFMKGLFAWVGFRQTGVEYVRAPRAAGTTKWKFWKLWNFALDGITASSTVPLRIWTYFGLLVGVVAVVYAAGLVIHTLVAGRDVPGYASIMVAVLFLGAINIVATGILGEYVGRIHAEVRNRPLYLVRVAYGIAPPPDRTTAWTGTYIAASTLSKESTGGSSHDAAS
jgi:glycosyltransferase involved in cell wall biosynthesis